MPRDPGRISGGRSWGPSGHTNRRSVSRPDRGLRPDRQAIAEAPTPEQAQYALKAKVKMSLLDRMPAHWRAMIHEYGTDILHAALRAPGLAGLGTVHDITPDRLRARCAEILKERGPSR